MSSRLLRGDEAKKLVTAWRPGRAPSQPAAATLQPAPGAPSSVDQQRELESRVQAAFKQGYAAAETAASQQANARLDPVIASFQSILEELARARRKFRAEAESDTVKLAIAIARRVIYRELSTDPEAILGLVIAAFQKLNSRETHSLRLSPKDAALLGERRDRLQMPPGIEIVPDSSLAPGSAIFETSRGEMDASVETQLAEIDRGFADILRRQLP